MDDPNTTNDIVKDVVFDDAAPAPTPAVRDRARWKMLAKQGAFSVNPDRCDIWTGNTRDVEALGSASFLDLIESISSVGQTIPAIARISPRDPERLEIIAGACRLTAIRRINEARSADDQLPIRVELQELDDLAALKVVDAENRGRSDMSQFELACFYDRAIPGIYATETELADALGLNKSTVNRTLAITKLPSEVMSLIKDRHAISAAQASAFLSDWGKPALRDRLNDAIDELAANGQASAGVVFKSLHEAVDPPGTADTVAIMLEDAEVGSVRRKRSGVVVIELRPEAGPLGWKSIAQATGVALKQLGPPREQ